VRILKTMTAAVLTLGLATSALAQTASLASRLSVVAHQAKSVARTGAKLEGKSSAQSSVILLGVLATIAIGAGVFMLADNDDKKPASP
jgi:hypothetical protein